jgi:hypothetical protein
MTARQGAALARVGVEQLNGKNADAGGMDHPPVFGDGNCCNPQVSIQWDARLSSKKLVDTLFKGYSK